MPRESSAGSALRLSLSSSSPSRSGIRCAASVTPYIRAVNSRCSSVVRYSKSCGSSGMKASSAFARTGSRARSKPPMWIAPRGRRHDAGEGAERRRLPRPVRPDEPEHFAGLHGEGEGTHRGELAVALGERFDLDHRRGTGEITGAWEMARTLRLVCSRGRTLATRASRAAGPRAAPPTRLHASSLAAGRQPRRESFATRDGGSLGGRPCSRASRLHCSRSCSSDPEGASAAPLGAAASRVARDSRRAVAAARLEACKRAAAAKRGAARAGLARRFRGRRRPGLYSVTRCSAPASAAPARSCSRSGCPSPSWSGRCRCRARCTTEGRRRRRPRWRITGRTAMRPASHGRTTEATSAAAWSSARRRRPSRWRARRRRCRRRSSSPPARRASRRTAIAPARVDTRLPFANGPPHALSA